jgi:hypothetical protein
MVKGAWHQAQRDTQGQKVSEDIDTTRGKTVKQSHHKYWIFPDDNPVPLRFT